MSTIGFREAYANSFEVSLADDLIVKVASMAGLALMKIVAWDERRLAVVASGFHQCLKFGSDFITTPYPK